MNEKKGYLLIDAELGGPVILDGTHAILELAVIVLPDPSALKKGEIEQFVKDKVINGDVRHFIIQPYGAVKQEILDNVVKKPLSYYKENGKPVEEVARGLTRYLDAQKENYDKIVAVSNWEGDIEVLDYLLTKAGRNRWDMFGTHNMFHLNSFVNGMLRGGIKMKSSRLPHPHDPRCDVKQMADIFVRAISVPRPQKSQRPKSAMPG